MVKCLHQLMDVTVCPCRTDKLRFRWRAARADGSYTRYALFSYASRIESRQAGEAVAREMANSWTLRK